ncbi:MAG: serine/threonine protein kinase, partial [Planctomycetes bacterium]|nr:serine/threonine protein kinase [Planctomycetota bacterium]
MTSSYDSDADSDKKTDETLIASAAALPDGWLQSLQRWQAIAGDNAVATESLSLHRQIASDEHHSDHAASADDYNSDFTTEIGGSSDYLILEESFQSGLAVLYHGYQHSLKRAVNIVKSQEGVQGGTERIMDEAMLLGSLQHPGISTIYDIGFDDNDAAYYAVRKLEGQWWAEQLQRPQTAEALDKQIGTLLRVCDVVSYIHKRGIMHGDIKPSHVRIGNFGEVVLSGWHAAAYIDEVEVNKIHSTAAYMAPEQAREEWDEIGIETDIYQLAGCLVHIICGSAPHVGEDFTEVMCHALQAKIIDAPDGVDVELWNIALAAMREQPDARTASVAEFRSQLEQWRSLQEGRQLFQAIQRRLAYASQSEYQLRTALYQLQNTYERWPKIQDLREVFYQTRMNYGRLAIDEGFIENALKMLPPMAAQCPARGRGIDGEKAADSEQQLCIELQELQNHRRHAEKHANHLAVAARWVIGVLLVGALCFLMSAKISGNITQQAMQDAESFLQTERMAIVQTEAAQQSQQRALIRSEIEHAIASVQIDRPIRGQNVLAAAHGWEHTWPWKRLLRRLHRHHSM